ncbi:MAG: hypothetical protein R2695_20140 [Acidimicrobiales bacterium]
MSDTTTSPEEEMSVLRPFSPAELPPLPPVEPSKVVPHGTTPVEDDVDGLEETARVFGGSDAEDDIAAADFDEPTSRATRSRPATSSRMRRPPTTRRRMVARRSPCPDNPS